MTSLPTNDSIREMCNSVKTLGYGAGQHIRLYGQEFEVLSDPFAEAGGIAVSVKNRKGSEVQVLQLPATVLQTVRGRVARAA